MLAIIILIWFVLGMIIDSISIMLLTVPIVEPVAMAFGFDQLSFAIVGIIAIEAGIADAALRAACLYRQGGDSG